MESQKPPEQVYRREDVLTSLCVVVYSVGGIVYVSAVVGRLYSQEIMILEVSVKRRFLGLPIPIIAVVLGVVLVSGGAAFAQYMFQRQQMATIQVLTTELEMSIPVEVELDFGTIRKTFTGFATSVSEFSQVFTLTNTGDDPLYVAMWQSGVGSDLVLVDAICGVIGDEANKTLFPLVWEVENSATITSELTAEWTEFVPVSVEPSAWPQPGVVKIDDEYIGYVTTNTNQVVTLTRGLYDSVPVYHPGAAVIEQGVYHGVSPLAPGAVLTVTLHLEAGENPARGVDDFILYINAQANPW